MRIDTTTKPVLSKGYSTPHPCSPDTLKSPRMKTIHNLLNLVSIFQVFSSLSLVSSLVSLVSQGHAEDALIGINQIETQTRLEWQSVTLVSSLPKLGSESRL